MKQSVTSAEFCVSRDINPRESNLMLEVLYENTPGIGRRSLQVKTRSQLDRDNPHLMNQSNQKLCSFCI